MRARFRSWWQKITEHLVTIVIAVLRALIVTIVFLEGYEWGAMFRSWWQPIRKHPVASVLISLFVALSVLVIFGGYKFNWDWTGFNRPSKTLWDWLQLLAALAIPIVVGFGAVWFTTRQGKVADAENKDNQRETALQTYIDKISELLLHEKLGELTEDGKLKPEYEHVRKIARVRTLTVLRELDEVRKVIVLQFLYESGLIYKDKCIVDLNEANLREINLQVVNLRGVNLRGVNLWRANLYSTNLEAANLQEVFLVRASLSFANLEGANLSEADLSGANLAGANLTEANLFGANVTQVQLDTADSLKGATMPDGTIHP